MNHFLLRLFSRRPHSGAYVDIRYRIDVTAQLSSGDILMEEFVFLISEPPNEPSGSILDAKDKHMDTDTEKCIRRILRAAPDFLWRFQ